MHLIIIYGPTFPAKIVLDRETGRSKGFGFVSFTCVDDAEAAMKGTDGTVSFQVYYFTSLFSVFLCMAKGLGKYVNTPTCRLLHIGNVHSIMSNVYQYS